MFGSVNRLSQGIARVAKLVDALCSGRSVGNHVLVRIQSRAQRPSQFTERAFYFKTEPSMLERGNKIKSESSRLYREDEGLCSAPRGSIWMTEGQSSPGHTIELVSHWLTSFFF